LYDVLRHPRVDLLGQADEARIKPVLPRLPRKVMGVERNAMSADSWARIEGHEAEGLGGGGADDFPGVYAEGVAEAGHFVCHPDVDGAEGVLQELGGLGDARRTHREDIFNDPRVEVRGSLGRGVRRASDDLRDVVRLELRVAGVNALGREGQQEIFVEPEPRLL
jgi:hypothetical protein